jgi:hypothetical protein
MKTIYAKTLSNGRNGSKYHATYFHTYSNGINSISHENITLPSYDGKTIFKNKFTDIKGTNNFLVRVNIGDRGTAPQGRFLLHAISLQSPYMVE